MTFAEYYYLDRPEFHEVLPLSLDSYLYLKDVYTKHFGLFVDYYHEASVRQHSKTLARKIAFEMYAIDNYGVTLYSMKDRMVTLPYTFMLFPSEEQYLAFILKFGKCY